jgi:outer membrane protein OmpA-like peptidoglycan-associated protein
LGFDAPNLEDMKKKGRIEIKVTPSKSKPPEEVIPQESAVTSSPPVAGQVADSHGVSPTHQKIAVSSSLETSSGGQTESTGGEIDDRLRGFLLNRVRKSPFSVEQKKSIEESIDKLRIGVHLFTAQFDSSSVVFSDESKNGLEQALAEKPDLFQKLKGELEFIIIGYASLPGTAPKNKALSIQRANAVAQTLRERFKVSLAVGYGATDVVGASSAENQVVEVFVGVPPKDGKARNLLDKLRNYINQSYGRE